MIGTSAMPVSPVTMAVSDPLVTRWSGHRTYAEPAAIPSTVDPSTGSRPAPAFPCGAPYRTNDMDRLGQVCSALPGATVDGMAPIREARAPPPEVRWGQR